MVIFETQEEFERAVMEVILKRLEVRPQLGTAYVERLGGVVLEIADTSLHDRFQEAWQW